MTAMAKAAPKVSVLMSVYNGELYLREAIESILNQTFEDFEFIIINDGSTDASQEIIDSFNDRRLVVIQQENIGLTQSLNKGLKIARGEYIARQDADDISFPNRFEKQVAYLDAHLKVAVLGGAIIRIDEKGNPLCKFVFPQSHEEIKKKLYKTENQLAHTTVMFRKQQINSLGNYNEIFEKCEDYELWLRVSHKFRLHNLSDVLAYHRFHIGSVTQSGNESKWLKNIPLALKIAVEQKRLGIYLPDSPYWKDFLVDFEKWYKTVSKVHERCFKANKMLKLSQACLANGNYLHAIQLLLRSIYTFPRILNSMPKRIIRYIRDTDIEQLRKLVTIWS